jgi:protein-S-isoprenylcysteine O-methyltransferase Ste14
LLVRIAVAVAIAIYIPPALWTRFEFAPTWLQVLGTVCLIVSTLFTVWARLALGSMWSRVAEIKVGHMLRTQGPYQITRHPIYTGISGMLFGSMLMEGFGRWIAYFLIGLVVVTSKIPSE